MYESIPVSRLPDVVGRHLTVHEAEPEDAAMDAAASALQGIQLFVCCHGSRDARCGSIGPPLARRLQTVAGDVGWADTVDVYMCSHIGGHKVRACTPSWIAHTLHHNTLRASGLCAETALRTAAACVQYAGNVLVFGDHPCSGDWFGGLRADDAEAFIAALTDMECASAHVLCTRA